jgi:hypothetical protein
MSSAAGIIEIQLLIAQHHNWVHTLSERRKETRPPHHVAERLCPVAKGQVIFQSRLSKAARSSRVFRVRAINTDERVVVFVDWGAEGNGVDQREDPGADADFPLWDSMMARISSELHNVNLTSYAFYHLIVANHLRKTPVNICGHCSQMVTLESL